MHLGCGDTDLRLLKSLIENLSAVSVLFLKNVFVERVGRGFTTPLCFIKTNPFRSNLTRFTEKVSCTEKKLGCMPGQISFWRLWWTKTKR